MKILITLFVLVCVHNVGHTQVLPSPISWHELGYGILRYDVYMSIEDPSSRRVVGRNRVTVERKAGTADTVLMLNLRSLLIDSVLLNGRVTLWTSQGDTASWTHHNRIVLGESSSVSVVDTVDVYYSGTMTHESGSSNWGGVSFDDGVLYALGVTFGTAYVSAAQHWIPVLDHPGYKPESFSLHCTVPGNYTVASVGSLDSVSVLSNGARTFHWNHNTPCATYLLTFGIGQFAIQESTHDGIPHVAFVLPRDTSNARLSLRNVPRMRTTFAQRYGLYPFEKVGYMSTRKGAMEHQTMIALNTQIVASRDTVNLTAAHELAHQWFGDLVTPRDFRYAWLTESFATFSELVWLEELFGRDRYLLATHQRASQYIGSIAGREGVFPLEDFPRATPSSNYPATIYQKGAVVIAMLRTVLGDTTFYRGLRYYLDQHAFGNATTQDFFSSMELATGANLQAFRREWVESSGWPILEVHHMAGPPSSAVIRQVQQLTHPTWPIFTSLPLNVMYVDAVTGTEVDTVLHFTNGSDVTIPNATNLRVNTGVHGAALAVHQRTTSIDASERNQSLEVFPNPAIDALTISIAEKGALTTDVSIVDVEGKIVWSAMWNGGTIIVDTSGFPQGRYLVVSGFNQSSTAVGLTIAR